MIQLNLKDVFMNVHSFIIESKCYKLTGRECYQSSSLIMIQVAFHLTAQLTLVKEEDIRK